MDLHDTWLLAERAKELECMYAVDEVLLNQRLTTGEAMNAIVAIIPSGFAHPKRCKVRLTLNGREYKSQQFEQADFRHWAPIDMRGQTVGTIEIAFSSSPGEEADDLLPSEVKLISVIAQRVSQLALSLQRELSLLLDTLERVDPDMLARIGEKLRVYLRGAAGEAADDLTGDDEKSPAYGEVNAPMLETGTRAPGAIARLVTAATSFLSIAQARDLFNGWIQEEQALSLVKTVDSKDADVAAILEAIRKYAFSLGGHRGGKTETWLLSELCHRFLTNDEHLIGLVLDNLKVADFEPMIEKVICTGRSSGNIGGKGAGLFIAQQIVQHAAKEDSVLANIKVPKTWYIAADQIVDFLHHNNLEEMNEYKYNSLYHLRMTYPGVVAKIRGAKLPPHVMQMLGIALDDLGERPIIVRSSSLLEDRGKAAFSGKYKSLFLANQGEKPKRLKQLVEAVLEVYSSMYNPDSIQYRKERELLNFTEQMGILIQEVVGQKIGPYFAPAYAGVAFSNNLLRWSPRIRREGGLVRIVMGLGTRAVDRVNDDYTVLYSPGQPGLRINQTPEDIRHYSQKNIDVIHLENGSFETVNIRDFLKECAPEIPFLSRMVSAYTPDNMLAKNAFELNPNKDDLVVTMEGVISQSGFTPMIKRLLTVLSNAMDTPVDIEFAFDGEALYLLQCRPQSHGSLHRPAPIPQQLDKQDVLFTANRFVPDGLIESISHIVYVSPEGYAQLATHEDLLNVGRAVGELNELLPRRKYILMGPGRWGSRGDIKLGVRVTYSDINNTAALIEIAYEKQSYVPELSFGTHFFQDLVERGIHYLPLYPARSGVTYRERFFERTDNMLGEILPRYAHLEGALRVIDVTRAGFGKTLCIHMNSELDEAVAFLTAEGTSGEGEPLRESAEISPPDRAFSWQWRHYMAQQLAQAMDFDELGVKGIYLFGSTNTGLTGIGSDIDLLIHVADDAQGAARANLLRWLDGWGRALARINFLRTGYDAQTLLDVHIVTDEDIARGDSYAAKINSVVDPATRLR